MDETMSVTCKSIKSIHKFDSFIHHTYVAGHCHVKTRGRLVTTHHHHIYSNIIYKIIKLTLIAYVYVVSRVFFFSVSEHVNKKIIALHMKKGSFIIDVVVIIMIDNNKMFQQQATVTKIYRNICRHLLCICNIRSSTRTAMRLNDVACTDAKAYLVHCLFSNGLANVLSSFIYPLSTYFCCIHALLLLL